MSIMTEALLKNLMKLETPILVVPVDSKKKKKLDEALEENETLGTRLDEPSPIYKGMATRIPSPVPG